MAEKKPTLSATLADLRKKGARVGSLSEFDMTPKGLTIGNLAIDALTGCGGLPTGRVVELFGPPSSGKTTTALQAAARLQEQPGCGHTMFLDYERSLDEAYCRALGIDPDAKCEDCGEPLFLYEQPRSFESGSNLFRQMMPWIKLLVTDSVAGMVTEHELSIDTGKVELGTRGRMMYQYLRQVVGPISDSGTCMVFLNHIQDVIDTSPMGQKLLAQGIKRTTTPGGVAIKFYSSLRISYKQIGNIKTEIFDPITNAMVSAPTQTKVEASVVKNKVGDPFGKAEVRVRFGKGFSNEWSALDVLVRHGLIKKDTGGIFRFIDPAVAPKLLAGDFAWSEKNGVPWLKGEDNVIAAMERQPLWSGAAISKARELVGQGWDVKLSDDEIKEIKAEEGEVPDEAAVLASSDEIDDVLGQS